MASSDNQAVQIALIVFVILTIILTVTTFLFYRSADTYRIQSETDRANANKAQTDLRAAVTEIEELKRLMGFEPSVTMEELNTTFQQDMQTYAGTFPPEKQFYRPAFEYLVTSLREAQTSLSDEKTTTSALSARNEVREAEAEQQIAQYRSAVEVAQRDVAGLRATFDEQRDRITREQRELAQQLKQSEDNLQSLRQEHASQAQELTSEIERLRLLLSDTQTKLAALTNDTFSTPDGRIIDVNQRRGLVWINLGEADALRRQITFSVFGADENNVNRVKRKGSIEVTQLLDNHMAEARIIDDMISDPILPGDKIYTPLWHPGRLERFALAGWMDLDGDDASDRQMVRELISMAGGVVDAEVDDEGNRTGEMTINTRFLVVGEERDNVISELGKLQAEALSLGVERITLDKFLDHIGWTDSKRVLKFGETSPLRFTPKPPDGGYPTSSGNISERFKKRPPRTRPEVESAF